MGLVKANKKVARERRRLQQKKGTNNHFETAAVTKAVTSTDNK